MRTILFLLALPCVLTSPAAVAQTIAAPDYVVTMIQRDVGSNSTRIRHVSHHGNWTRMQGDDSPPWSEYIFANGKMNVLVFGSGSNWERGENLSLFGRERPSNTHELQTYLGESCTVWDLSRDHFFSPYNLSCITDDGITLWKRTFGRAGLMSSLEATQVERRPVAPEEVQPPKRLQMPDWWDRAETASAVPTAPDHESIMMLSDNPKKNGARPLRTRRRSGSWQSVEDVDNERRTFNITDDSKLMWLYYASDDIGAPKQLRIMKLQPAPGPAPLRSMQPRDLARTETVLGENCRWFDMTPGMMDVGRSACLANDGIVMKEQEWRRGGSQTWTAERLTRRPVRLDEIKPPESLFDPRQWGIEQ